MKKNIKKKLPASVITDDEIRKLYPGIIIENGIIISWREKLAI